MKAANGHALLQFYCSTTMDLEGMLISSKRLVAGRKPHMQELQILFSCLIYPDIDTLPLPVKGHIIRLILHEELNQ